MGNFSRSTFDPLRDYVAVRLQQGVPVLDADWNELNDVARQELYDTCSLTFTDGVRPHTFDLEVGSRQEPNDFSVLAGMALIQGRAVRVRKNVRYSTQPWTDPQRAARDGVAVIPPLTTPAGPAGAPPRTDIVYLDVWEREVDSAEDDNLINPAIGVETCLRVKRETAVRVAEGTATLPAPPPGHLFLPLALLRRPPNEPQFFRIEDIRPFFYSPQGTGVVSLFPAFLPVYTAPAITPSVRLPEWRITFSPLAASGTVPKFRAVKELNEAATGILPLTLPDRARLSFFSINGDISAPDGQLHWQILRISHQLATALNANQLFDVLAESTVRAVSAGQSFGTTSGFSAEEPKLVVDNGRYHYALLVRTFSAPAYVATIHGMSVIYKYFGLAGEPGHEHD